MKLVLMAGRTATCEGIWQIDDNRYMADSREPEKRRALRRVVSNLVTAYHGRMPYPVKNIFPILADEKLKTDDGLALLTTSRLNRFRKDRMSSFLCDEISVHSGCRASTIASHSIRAASESAGRRWLKNALMAAVSWSSSPLPGIKRTRRPVTGFRVRQTARTWY